MPRISRAMKALKSCDDDRISALPDDVLHHVLGFLQADEAVHTCLLARRWRYLWKSMHRICINDMGSRGKSTKDVFLNKFMSYLLLLRDPGSTLDEFIFRRDLRWCPTFSKLKTLLLNDWCVQPDPRPLVSMLEHSPVLENLTLQLRKRKKPTGTLEVEENAGLMEKPAAISGHLKIIKVKCEEVDSRVCKVLKFLSAFGIEITIQRTNG